MTVRELAQQTRRLFILDKRADGTTFYKTEGERAEWLETMIRDAHADGEMFPDDHRYAFIVEALDELAEVDDADDAQMEPDILNHDLLTWLASHGLRPSYCDEFDEEHGLDTKPTPIMERISRGQWCEKDLVLQVVRSALQAQVEDEEESDETDE